MYQDPLHESERVTKLTNLTLLLALKDEYHQIEIHSETGRVVAFRGESEEELPSAPLRYSRAMARRLKEGAQVDPELPAPQKGYFHLELSGSPHYFTIKTRASPDGEVVTINWSSRDALPKSGA
jgi:hypothetical protein